MNWIGAIAILALTLGGAYIAYLSWKCSEDVWEYYISRISRKSET